MLNNKSIGFKFYTILFSAIIIMIGIVVAFYIGINHISNESSTLAGKQMYELQKDRIKDITLSAAKGLEDQIRGKSTEEQLKIIDQFLTKSRFDANDSGYFFLYEETTVRLHPINRQIQGKDIGDSKDSVGVYFIRELRDVAKAGGGFVTYMYPKPDGKIDQKTAYVVMISGTNYWFGTGVYTENVALLEKQLHTNMINQANTIELYLILAVFALIIIMLIASIKVIKSITGPISLLTTISTRVAEGDLSAGSSVTINTQDSTLGTTNNEVDIMSNAINRMVSSLREKIQDAENAIEESKKNAAQIQKALDAAAVAEQNANTKTEHMLHVADNLEEVVNKLSFASENLAQTIIECEHGASEQAQQISNTSEAMEEMNATVNDVAQSASLASNVSSETGIKAQDCGRIANEAISSMQDVQKLTTRLMEDMQSLDVSAKSIDQVMGVISEIADQTNLLALNAAIEAARAGEAGRGFAVVADEVRKLAEKTMDSTNEVAKIINEIQLSASQSLTQTTASFAAIEKATELVMQSGETLTEITNMTKNSAEQVHSIAAAAEEQSVTTKHIKDNMNQVNEIALITVQSMGDATQSVQDLKDQAQELTKLTRSLKEDK